MERYFNEICWQASLYCTVPVLNRLLEELQIFPFWVIGWEILSCFPQHICCYVLLVSCHLSFISSPINSALAQKLRESTVVTCNPHSSFSPLGSISLGGPNEMYCLYVTSPKSSANSVFQKLSVVPTTLRHLRLGLDHTGEKNSEGMW